VAEQKAVLVTLGHRPGGAAKSAYSVRRAGSSAGSVSAANVYVGADRVDCLPAPHWRATSFPFSHGVGVVSDAIDHGPPAPLRDAFSNVRAALAMPASSVSCAASVCVTVAMSASAL
jgi:hypothetical protein